MTQPPVPQPPPGEGAWLAARLSEPSSWQGIAAFFAAVGGALAAGGLMQTGLIVGALGVGFGGVGSFIAKE